MIIYHKISIIKRERFHSNLCSTWNMKKHTTQIVGKVSLEIPGSFIPAFDIGIFLIRQIYDPVAKYRNTEISHFSVVWIWDRPGPGGFMFSFGEQALSQLYRKLVPLTAALGGIGHPRNGVVWGWKSPIFPRHLPSLSAKHKHKIQTQNRTAKNTQSQKK